MASNTSLAPTIAPDVADSALACMQYGQDHLKWLAALMKAIQLDAEHNHSRTLIDLASLGHYLSGDCADYLAEQSQQLQRQLDTSGGDQ